MLLISLAVIIIIIERKDLGGVMSKDCKDTLQMLETDKTRVRREVRTEYLFNQTLHFDISCCGTTLGLCLNAAESQS